VIDLLPSDLVLRGEAPQVGLVTTPPASMIVAT